MSTAQEVNGWLTDIGRRLGHDLSLDDDGRCQHAIHQEADDGKEIDADVLETVLPEDPRH